MRGRARSALAAALLLGLAGSPARAADILEVVEENGPSANRIDLVFTGDGYTAAEANLFRQHVDAALAGLFGETPWSSYRGLFNIYRVVTESAESGADHPSQGISRDTYFDAEFDYLGIERLTYANETKIVSVVTGLLPEADQIVLLINDPAYGGSGGGVAMASADPDAVFILVHELGHSMANLADEYTDPYPGYPPGDPEPNVDVDTIFADIKWSPWIEAGTPLPTSLADATGDYLPVGAYEGARYQAAGIFRPAPHCLMQSLVYRYCDVCREAMVLGLYGLVDPLDAVGPVTVDLTVDRGRPDLLPVVFVADAVEPTPGSSIGVSWTLDGLPVASGPAYPFDPNRAGVPNGVVTLTAEALDPTPWVRTDPLGRLRSARSWTITVVGEGVDAGPPGPDGGGDGGIGPRREPKGCGCDAGGGPQGARGGALWLLFAAVGLALGRRRRRPVHGPGRGPSRRGGRTRRTAW